MVSKVSEMYRGTSMPAKLARRTVSMARRAATGNSTVVLDAIYRAILQRAPDANAMRDYLPVLRAGEISVEQIGRRLIESDEFSRHSGSRDLGISLHRSRCDFVRSLPRAKKILDLGGTNLLHEYGAMVVMGYPYSFDEIVIVDLLPEDRHPNYDLGGVHSEVETGLGTVRYAYHSMSDLTRYEDESFDLVYSGQSIEHITLTEGDVMLQESLRVLRPGGWLAVDTPNSRVTRLQQEEFIDPDHKYEYSVDELRQKIILSGFEIFEEKGLNLATRCLESGEFSSEEVASHAGLYAEIDDCYLMAFVCRKP